jgi:hypothetical protein
MRDEIAEDVTHVEWKVAPHIQGRAGNRSSSITAEFQKVQDTRAATLERLDENFRAHLVSIDASRHREAVLLAERLDPHAASIVNVTGEHPNGAARRSGHLGVPELGGQMLDEKNCYPIIGVPGGKDCVSQVESRRHTAPFEIRRLTPTLLEIKSGADKQRVNAYCDPGMVDSRSAQCSTRSRTTLSPTLSAASSAGMNAG